MRERELDQTQTEMGPHEVDGGASWAAADRPSRRRRRRKGAAKESDGMVAGWVLVEAGRDDRRGRLSGRGSETKDKKRRSERERERNFICDYYNVTYKYAACVRFWFYF